jgi:hypothetical protein
MTGWTVWIVLALLATYIVTETLGSGSKLREGFAVPRRTDIGLTSEGWSAEEGDYIRDLRYTEGYTDVQGTGVAADFCRAVYRKGDPDSLHVACALATREGMDTLEFRSPTQAQGFRFSRDDYWRDVTANGRMDYCRVLKDDDTGEWISRCAVTTREGIGAGSKPEIRDPSPPDRIQQLLRAYEGILTWYRWQDDATDYAGNTHLERRGHPEFPTLLHPEKSRGLQCNRWPAAVQDAGEEAKPAKDLFLWGERETMHLDQDVKPSQIRAISFWVWWDAFEKGARILECSNGPASAKKDLVWIGVDSYVGPELRPAPEVMPAVEMRPQQVFALGTPQAEPMKVVRESRKTSEPMATTGSASLIFEVWDTNQRLFRLTAPDAAKTHQWQHVVITTTDKTSWWPTWQIWVDGQKAAEKVDGRAIPALLLTQNTIGKDFRGCLQDFRVYNRPMTERDIQETIAWGKPVLHPLP